MTSIAAAAKTPPKFVVKALFDYRSASPIELSIRRGDFFMVTALNPPTAASLPAPPEPPGPAPPPSDALRNADPWIEVTDPVRNLKGLIPKNFVDMLERTGHAKNAAPLPSPASNRVPSGGGGYSAQPPLRTSSSANAADDVARRLYGMDINGGDRLSATSPTTRLSGSTPHSPRTPNKLGPPTTSAAAVAAATAPAVYPAVVQYDFEPEQGDELRAASGDNVLILAHSGLEWVMAKFIDKLGDPGMIPVNYLLVRDPATNQPIRNFQEVLRQGHVLTTKNWRAKEQARAQRVIALGVLPTNTTVDGGLISPPIRTPTNNGGFDDGRGSYGDNGNSRVPQRVSSRGNDGLGATSFYSSTPSYAPATPMMPPPGAASSSQLNSEWRANPVVQVSVPSYKYRPDAIDFWYQINACLANGAENTLYRRYDNFEEMHSELERAFPEEAGKSSGGGAGGDFAGDLLDRFGAGRESSTIRIMPYLPGYVSSVTEDVARKRRMDLETYLQALLALPPRMLQHPCVSHFFKPRGEDITGSAPLLTPGGNSAGMLRPGSEGLSDLSRDSAASSGYFQLRNSGGGMSGVSGGDGGGGGGSQGVYSLKIKVVHGSDIMAIRCNPATITRGSLLSKVATKLFNGDVDAIARILWRRPGDQPGDPGYFVEIDNDDALVDAVHASREKMVLYVQ